MINKIKYLLYFLFFSEYVFTKPTEKKVLIYDDVGSKYLKIYFKRKDLAILNTRILDQSINDFKKKELNLFIVFKMLLNFQFSFSRYKELYLKFVNPKYIVTFIDNNFGFYNIKNIIPDSITIFIQNSHRMSLTDIFSKINLLKKYKDFKVDYMCVFNEYIGKKYNSFIKGKIIPIGSFISNSIPIRKFNTKKKYILYISNYRSVAKDSPFIKNISWGEYCLNEEKLLHSISTYLSLNKNNNLILKVLGRDVLNHQNEKKYFSYFFKNNDFFFIPRTKYRSTYKYIDNAELVINIESTLGYTSFSRGTKTAFFSVRNNKKQFESTKIGWPGKKKVKTEIWTNSHSLNEVGRVLSNLLRLNKREWLKLRDLYLNDIMIYDLGNSKFSKLLSFLKI